jgi:hypothetical protein
MPHLISTAYTTGEVQPDNFEVTIDSYAMVESTPQTLGDSSVRLYFDLAGYNETTHTYSIIALDGVLESDPATGSFDLERTLMTVPFSGSVWIR